MGERITFSGLSTGIDFQSIVDVMILAERRRIDLVMLNKAEEQAKLTAIQGFNTLLLGLRTSATSLSKQSSFQTLSATSTQENLILASVTGNAAPGTHILTVNRLAQAHQLASQGFADTDTTSLGTGTVTIQVGSGASTAIEIDASNNTLSGLRDAINNSDAGVTASIIHDGSSLNPYRLLLSGSETGAANTIDVTVDLTGGTAPDFTNKTIDAVEAGAYNSAAYTGAATASGTYTGDRNQTFLVEIMTGGAVGAATFRYSTDGGLTFNDNGGAGFVTSAGGTALEDGVSIAFSDSGTLTWGDTFSIDTFVPTIQAAQDASVTLGSASGGGAPITVTSATNTLTDIIPGVKVTLVGADSATPVTITVESDTEAVRGAIEGFVESYNEVIDFLNDQLDYDAALEEAGPLIGDSLLISVQNDLRRIATGVIGGLPSDMNRLGAVGITSVSETGKLVIDDAKLDKALAEDLSGVANLFATSSSTTNPDITFLSSTGKTVFSSTGFNVNITQAATQGVLEGDLISSFPVTLTASNNQIRLKIDGKESSILTLTAKTYSTGDELAAEIQAKINADPALAGRHVVVSYSAGRLVFTSSTYGSSSMVELGTEPPNSAFTDLGLSNSISTAGKDVAGTINGEQATGKGQILKGNAGNLTTDGLSLLVTLTPSEVDPLEAEGVVTVIDGVASRLSDTLGFLTDPVDGRVTSRTDTLTRQIEEFDEDIKAMEIRLEEKRIDLLEEFARLEASLAELSSQGEFLIQQLASLPMTNTLSRRDD
ncbi:MAG: hypothetical protein C4520_10660 [Candidatus Abyssobacteria bacterium SURF_5]|uniref:Flagellar hook-associated protein 2 n=1 Tax=Abyssobacteria bacterium (strain SURF_5) TaxID=2093360 RepID=A0A3A4NJL3_ABYX5|nr:MAG: hypothetical protein C4520_10660 [Candidatus Abyssubacteria bacterium SURF_5]